MCYREKLTGLGQRFSYGWIVVAACFTIFTVVNGIRFSFGVFFKPLESDFGWSRALTSGIFSVQMVLFSIFGILGGWAIDRYGPKIVFTVMGASVGLSLALTSQVNEPWQLFFSYSLLLAIGSGPVYPAIMSLISRWFIRSRGLALGIVSAGTGIGIMIMAPVSQALIWNYGWHTSYLIMSLMAFFALIPCALSLRRAPIELATLSDSKEIATAEPSVLGEQRRRAFSLSYAVKTTSFWLVFLVQFLLASCVYIILGHIVRHAIDLGITSQSAASVLSVIGGLSILGRLVMGSVSDVIGRKTALLASASILGGAMLLLIWSSNLGMLQLFAVTFGFSWGAFGPLLAALIGDIFWFRHLGVITGVLAVGWGAGAAFGPALAGYMFDITGSYTLAFIVGIIAVLMAIALLIFVRSQDLK